MENSVFLNEELFLDKTNSLLGSISCRIWKYGDSYGKSDETVHSSVVGSKKIGLFDHLLAARYLYSLKYLAFT